MQNQELPKEPRPGDEEIYAITFEQVEETAEEFGRVAVSLPAHQMIIVMDDTLIGPGCIKQFDNSTYGLACARRWAVRLDDDDETSAQSFEELRAAYLKEIEPPEGFCLESPR